jgi:hypothetical protein
MPAFGWFLAGLIIGLGISAFLFMGGYLPEKAGATPAATSSQPAATEPALIGESEETTGNGNESRFDFFTVLPEMEVIVPDQELSGRVRPGSETPGAETGGSYILQAGSFRNASDAEQKKASLALIGVQASIQVVTVNDATWHRVRIGPVQSARRADEMRRILLDHGHEVLVLKDSSG